MSTRKEKGGEQKVNAFSGPRESWINWGLSVSRETRVLACRDQSPSPQSSYITISILALRNSCWTVWRRETHLVSVLPGKTIYCVFPDASTVHVPSPAPNVGELGFHRDVLRSLLFFNHAVIAAICDVLQHLLDLCKAKFLGQLGLIFNINIL